jgi:hypothetical protein
MNIMPDINDAILYSIVPRGTIGVFKSDLLRIRFFVARQITKISLVSLMTIRYII